MAATLHPQPTLKSQGEIDDLCKKLYSQEDFDVRKQAFHKAILSNCDTPAFQSAPPQAKFRVLLNCLPIGSDGYLDTLSMALWWDGQGFGENGRNASSNFGNAQQCVRKVLELQYTHFKGDSTMLPIKMTPDALANLMIKHNMVGKETYINDAKGIKVEKPDVVDEKPIDGKPVDEKPTDEKS
jgi:hypothetical protein